MKTKKIISKDLVIRSAIIIVVSCACALVFNALRPGGIPFIQDWDLRDLAVCTDGSRIPWLETNEAIAMFEGGQALFIDARTPAEFDAGHIPNAINVPYDEFDSYLELLLEQAPMYNVLVTYCDGAECHSSIELAIKLCNAKLGDTRIFFGGAEEWTKAGMPLE